MATAYIETAFEGIITNLERRFRETQTNWIKEEIEYVYERRTLRRLPWATPFERKPGSDGGGHQHCAFLRYDPSPKPLLSSIRSTLTAREAMIAAAILKEIRSRLGFLRKRGAAVPDACPGPPVPFPAAKASVSAWPPRSVRSLMGVLYILDEPSIGLHQRDNDKLLSTLQSLRDMGNTVLVVEHDEETMLRADHIVDIGPGAGMHGGQVVYNGPGERYRLLSGIHHRAVPAGERKCAGSPKTPEGQW